MVDTHYDLLTICYNCYLKKDYSKIESIANEIKSSGVKCIFGLAETCRGIVKRVSSHFPEWGNV